MTRIYLVAAEPSGDALGADFIQALRASVPDIQIGGVGGSAMAAAGVASDVSIEGLAVLGLIEGLQALKTVEARAVQTASACAEFRPDAVVLIDSWGFTLRCARQIRSLLPGIPLIKMVGPQVWATRPGRAKTVAEAYDALFCIHAFEVPIYHGTGLPITVIGNPAVSRDVPGDGAQFTTRHGLEDKRQLLLLLGSRRSEIERVAPSLEQAAARICATRPDVMVTSVLAPSVEALVRARAEHWSFPHLLVSEAEKADAFAGATAALACSGTVTTEVAMQGTPVVVGYRLGWITWSIVAATGLFKSPFITLLNVAAGQAVAPEFVQLDCTPTKLAAAVSPLLDDPVARDAQVTAQNQALAAMGRGQQPTAERATEALLAILASRQNK